jgi:predicted ATP-grasp superfamily ATP-dependent carboligase
MDKTAIFFSNQTKREAREYILAQAGVQATMSYETYLGLPAFVGKSNTRTFRGLKERIWGRMNGWKEKFLSQAGKEILDKS